MDNKYTFSEPPRTAMEVFKTLPEGTWCEVIDGVLYMLPIKVTEHQRVLANISFSFYTYLKSTKKAIGILGPIDVYLDEHNNVVEPDFVIVLNENASILRDYIHGVPNILIEILSKGNESHDLVRKKELYETKEVNEYFIIDPNTKEVIHYIYQNNSFVLQTSVSGELNSLVLKNKFVF